MSLVGNLEDLGLGEILQIVSLSRKSGILSLQSKGREGKVFFRNGQVTQATSSTYRRSLGEVLVRKEVIDLNQLKLALAIQEREAFRERLGSILIRCFGVPSDIIAEVVRDQIEKAVYSLFVWSDGTFAFDLQESGDAADTIRLDPMQFMLDEGLNPQYLAMEGTRIIDERRHRGELGDDPVVPDEPGISGDDPRFDLSADTPGLPLRTAGEPSERTPVVVVDDDAVTREALGFLLVKAGYEPFLHERSEEGLIRLDTLTRSGRKPVAVIDLNMPRMDGGGILGGVELIELARANFTDLPLVAIADYLDPQAQPALCTAHAAFVLKPRRGEIADPALLKEFNERLIPALRSKEFLRTTEDKIDLGMEIRSELGEEEPFGKTRRPSGSGLSRLRGMLSELNSPAQGGGIILMVLRYAAEFLDRAVIFMVKKDEIAGLGQFGVKDGVRPAAVLVRGLRIPRQGDSLFRTAIDTQIPVKLRPDEAPWNRFLFDQLGEGTPQEVFLGPLISEGKVVAILYGDRISSHRSLGDTEGLEIFLDQAGLAMEKALLQRRLKEQAERPA